MTSEAQAPVAPLLPSLPVSAAPDTSPSLCGVRGWLKFLVVMNLYVGPVLFGLAQLLGWLGCALVAEEYPGIVLVTLIDTVAGIFLVGWGIQVARGLRDIKPRAVQNAKALLRVSLAWTFVSIPISFVSGFDAEALVPGIIKSVLAGLISFAIWNSYFSVSRRVQATYPDWNEPSASPQHVSSGGSCASPSAQASQDLA